MSATTKGKPGSASTTGSASSTVSSSAAASGMDLLYAPFQVFRVPDFKLRYPTSLPSWNKVFAITFVVYFLITAGIIYDRIVEPPAIGSEQDPRTGAVKPVVFVQYRVNGQFIIEGLSSAFFFCLGGVGLILLEFARSGSQLSLKTRRWFLGFGIGLVVVAFLVLRAFIRIKVPNYLIGME